VALISDEPIRVGDFCQFADKLGTVEDIGLRSTRVRTLDRTILSIPNGQLSLMTLENFTLRDKFLFRHKIGLRYETTPEQMRCVLTQIRELLRSHPKVDQGDARARLIGFADSSFTVEVFAHIVGEAFRNFLETQEELLLLILDIIVAAGSAVAYPSRTLYVARDKPQDPALVEQAATRVQQRLGQIPPATAGDSNSVS
jgi:MscS family membrane protein